MNIFRIISTFVYKVNIELFELRVKVIVKEILSSRIVLDKVELSKGRSNYQKEPVLTLVSSL